MKMTLLVLVQVLSLNAFAGGAEVYPTLAAVKAADFYRLTCSDVVSEIQAHVVLEVKKGVIQSAKIVTVAPAESLAMIDLSKKTVSALQYKIDNAQLSIVGDLTNTFSTQSLSLTVVNGSKGLEGRLNYDDGEGARLNDRTVSCGALSYTLSPTE